MAELERDPMLAEWFGREQALDAAIGQKLREFPVPADLRQTILAGPPSVEAPALPRRWAPLAIAAALMLLVTLAGIRFANSGRDFSACRVQMVEHISSLRLDFASARLPEIKEWLFANRQISGYSVPDRLRNLPAIGCKTWTWRGQPVALICFSLGEGGAVHLFVLRRSALSDPPSTGHPQVAAQGGWMTGSWTEGAFVYVIARRGDEASLRGFLPGAGV